MIGQDGARLWNACIATGISLGQYSQHFDTVSLCLSKGIPAQVMMSSIRFRLTFE
jgi:threonine aldolase